MSEPSHQPNEAVPNSQQRGKPEERKSLFSMPSLRRSRSTLRPPSKERPTRKLSKSRPGSRNTSPSPLRRRHSKLNEYLAKSSRRNSTATLTAPDEVVPTLFTAREIKRWDGLQRLTEKWDFVRRVCHFLPSTTGDIDCNRIQSYGCLKGIVSCISTNAEAPNVGPRCVSF